MFQQLWLALHRWAADNPPAFWAGVGVLLAAWLALGLTAEHRARREVGGVLVFGYPFGMKLAFGVVSLVLIPAVVVGLDNYITGVGWGGLLLWPLLFVAWLAAAGLFVAFLAWLPLKRELRLDPANRAWRLDRGLHFAPRRRVGSFDDIAHLLLERTVHWGSIRFRVLVVWHAGVEPFVLDEAEVQRPPVPVRLAASAAGADDRPGPAERSVRRQLRDRLEGYAGKLGLPAVVAF